MEADVLAEHLEQYRPELLSFLTRLVIRVAVAEELVQETALRALQHRDQAPATAAQLRPWLFRIASNLGIDHCRKRGVVREKLLLDARRAAEQNPEFIDQTQPLRGTAEMSAIAREHLVACFACTLGQLPAQKVAILLLREVYDFTNQEIAELLQLSSIQIKNGLQQARRHMQETYTTTCALLNKQGICYQCVELDQHYRAQQGNPLAQTAGTLSDRLEIVRQWRHTPAGTWTKLLSNLLDDLL